MTLLSVTKTSNCVFILFPQEENSKFQKVLNESSVQLNKLAKRIGEKVVSEARPYYEAISKLKTLQIKCQKAAIKFEKYNELHAEAKQAIADTELMFLKEEEEKRDRNEEDVQDNGNFDHSWQEKLNQANINVSGIITNLGNRTPCDQLVFPNDSSSRRGSSVSSTRTSTWP